MYKYVYKKNKYFIKYGLNVMHSETKKQSMI